MCADVGVQEGLAELNTDVLNQQILRVVSWPEWIFPTLNVKEDECEREFYFSRWQHSAFWLSHVCSSWEKVQNKLKSQKKAVSGIII